MTLREKLLSKVKKGSFLYSVLTITSGTVIAQTITIVLSPVITRLYTPEDMGVLASYTAITSILGVIAAGCYQSAIVLPKTQRETNAVAYAGLGISVLLGCLITLICIIFKQPLIRLLKFEGISTGWFYALGFFVTLLGFDVVLNQLAIKNQHFRMIAERQITQQISTNGIKIAIGCVRSGSLGLFFATFFGQIVKVVKMGISEITYLTDKNNRPTKKDIWESIKRYKKFPLVSSWSVLLNSASTQLPVILFTALFSSSVSGYYSLAHRILSLPMTLIGSSIGTVFLSKASSVRENKDELAKITYEIAKKMFILGSLGMSIIFFYGDILFGFVFGSEWIVAGQYTQWMSIWLLYVFVISPLSVVYNILEYQEELLVVNGIMFLSRIAVLYGCFFLNVESLNTVMYFSVLGAILWSGLACRIMTILQISFFRIAINVFLIPLGIFSAQFLLSCILRSVF